MFRFVLNNPIIVTVGILIICLFHLSNAFLFRIGVFPWLMIGATTIFLDTGWPRHLWARLRRRTVIRPTLSLPAMASGDIMAGTLFSAKIISPSSCI